MKTAYLHCASGISGDMLLAALLDAGASPRNIENTLRALDIGDWQMELLDGQKCGFACKRLTFHFSEAQSCRNLADIVSIIEKAAIAAAVKQQAINIFRILATAEGAAHGIAAEEVHFHEVGAVDSILDTVGIAAALAELQIGSLWASPLPIAQGETNCAHGLIPLPAPALQSLLTGVQIYGKEAKKELVTPTGLAVLKAYRCRFGEFPVMTVERTGVGGGSADFSWPNVLRVFLGNDGITDKQTIVQLETIIDDMTGEEFGFLWDHVFALGALDCHYVPIQMKKGRPGIKLHILARPEAISALEDFLFTHTSTFGLIHRQEQRRVLERQIITIDSPWGDVKLKIGHWETGEKAVPEYEDMKRMANKTGLSLRQIHAEIMSIYNKHRNGEEHDDDQSGFFRS